MWCVRSISALRTRDRYLTVGQDEEGNYKLPLDEVQTIKQELVGLMIAAPPTIQTQLGEAISLIADSDFWERWDTLTKVCLDSIWRSR